MTNKPLIIYHDKCTDGFGAAFAAWMKFRNNAEYVPASYGQAVATGMLSGIGAALTVGTDMFSLMDREVYVVDFSFDKPVMDFIFAQAGKVVWLDHHKTAFEMWCTDGERELHCEDDQQPGNRRYILLDNDKSGALLAWEYFHPNVPVPELIKCIDDRDRWVFQYADSKAVHAGLAAATPWTFDQWERLCTPMLFDATVLRGHAILAAENANVARMAAQAMPCRIEFTAPKHEPDTAGAVPASGADGYQRWFNGLAVNASIHQSELGHVVATKSGTYALVWYLAADGRANCSLRSNGDYDVSVIAKAFSGGGHRNAAGFQIDMDTLLGWLK